ncbi:regulator of G-protein signaling 14-like [Conger conger]|uniref:regulator of G-protein signaling 14-like n=1 Tax=Conger conger TaxID=82655 RepID=UPI002A59A1B2|nr:regulator of G-protein signaling 14-like [Conger conger]
MSWKTKNLGVHIGQGAQAVSDGELNMITSEGSGGSHSMVGKVASWAVSFERLLMDPTGVGYFTAFLKSEVSAENILFWQACEKFQQIPAHQKEELTRAARSIFDKYLSHSAFHAVNIDETARITESDLQNPKPDMFRKAQQQIFKLMKFDSYTRFIRSQLYQKCMLAEVEFQPLPGLGLSSKNLGAKQNSGSDDSFNRQKNTRQPEKFSRLEMEAERRRRGQESRAAWDRGGTQKGSREAKVSERCLVPRGPCDNSTSLNIQSGSTEQLKMGTQVFPLANKTVIQDRAKGNTHGSIPQVNVQGLSSQRRGAITAETVDSLQPSGHQVRPNTRTRNNAVRKTYDNDGFEALLSRAEWSSVDDQRGLLRKEHLVMPTFLQLPQGEGKKEEQEEKRGSEEPCPTSSCPATAPVNPTQAGGESAVGLAASSATDSDAQCYSPLSLPEGSFFCTDLSRETVV